MSEIHENPVDEEQIDSQVNVKEDIVNNKKRKFKEVAPFGNYRSYYGYRVGNDMEKDPRFTVLKKDWFEGKDCLDIGCNSGLITLNIAKKFQCRSILGLDIDRARISDAWSRLKKFKECRKSGREINMTPKSKIVTDVNELRCAETCSTSVQVKNDGSSVEPNLFDVVSFRCGNFVSDSCYLPYSNYDTIICLSVTKWVHLNWGDEGLISLFSKIWRLLHPGGILVLEPQPWSSYYNNRLTTEVYDPVTALICVANSISNGAIPIISWLCRMKKQSKIAHKSHYASFSIEEPSFHAIHNTVFTLLHLEAVSICYDTWLRFVRCMLL